MFSLELPQRGDSNEYTQYANFSTKKKITLNYSKIADTGLFSKGIKNNFETAVVNEPSVFEKLKFFCIAFCYFCVSVVCSSMLTCIAATYYTFSCVFVLFQIRK